MAGMPMEAAEPIQFAAGDLFVMITDGFLEWCGPKDDQYGSDRLVEVLRRHHREPCDQLIQLIYRDVLDYCQGTPQADDLTAIVIKRTS
jgi:serine phosphatase RsbU (regulator of sigma subunit)